MAKHSITAVFDTRAHAEQAMAQLTSTGIPSSDITLLPADGEAAGSAAAGGGKGFWGSLEQLFGGTEDHATYAESIRRGGVMLSVRADDDRLDHVVDILERHGSVDLDEREASWRREGWTGDAGGRGLAQDDPGMTAMGGGAGSGFGGAASRSDTAMPGVGTLGAGLLGAGSVGTAMHGERREIPEPIRAPIQAPVRAGTMAETVAETRATPVAGLAAEDRVADRGDRVGMPAVAGGADETVRLYEERLDVGKRAVSRGKVRVHTSVVSRDVSENISLHAETVSVDRRSVDRPVSAAALDADPFRERTIEMEEYAEEAVIAKSAHVVEEIGIHREAVDRVETVHETLRKTVVDIEDGRTVTGSTVGSAVGMAGASAGAAAGALGRFAAEIRDDMEVVGSDGAHVGTVDHLDGGRIKLKKADPASGGEHHYLTHDMVHSVAGKVMLAVTAAEAKSRWATA